MLKGISAALVAAGVGLLLIAAIAMVVWVGEPRTSAPIGDVLRTAGAFWLLGHGTRLHLPDGTAGLLPLGLTLLFAALARRAGGKVARVRPAARRGRAIVGSALCVAVPYGVTAALVAAVVSTSAVRVSTGSAALGGFVVAVLAAAVGAARELPRSRPESALVSAGVRGLVTALAAMLAVAAVAVALMLVTHLSDAADFARPEKAGVVGGVGLLALQTSLAPNVLTWTAAYLVGPGFAVGAGTVVSPGRVHLGDVPGLPLLAALPGGSVPWPLYVLYAVAPLAGVLGGVTAMRRLRTTPRLRPALALGAGMAVAVGVCAGLLALLSGGPVAAGRLATVGPSPLLTGAFAALEIGVPALLTVLGLVGYERLWLTREAAAGREPGRRLGERLGGWSSAAGATLGRPVRALQARRHRSDGEDAGTDEVTDADDRAGTDEQPTVVIDLTKHDAAIDQALASDEPERSVVDLTAPAQQPAAEDWDGELTQDLDLTGLDELVAQRAAEADLEVATDDSDAADPSRTEGKGVPGVRRLRSKLRRRKGQ